MTASAAGRERRTGRPVLVGNDERPGAGRPATCAGEFPARSGQAAEFRAGIAESWLPLVSSTGMAASAKPERPLVQDRGSGAGPIGHDHRPPDRQRPAGCSQRANPGLVLEQALAVQVQPASPRCCRIFIAGPSTAAASSCWEAGATRQPGTQCCRTTQGHQRPWNSARRTPPHAGDRGMSPPARPAASGEEVVGQVIVTGGGTGIGRAVAAAFRGRRGSGGHRWAARPC